MRWILATILACAGLAAQADDLMVLKLSTGQAVALKTGADGLTVLGVFNTVTVIESTPDPPKPPPANNWSVTGGLHVLIVDDENLRGKLPQSQINIFTSKPLRDWLDASTPKGKDGRPAYRFASNDSLVEGGEARKQELPVYVQGWDLLMKSGVSLPAWIVANGEQTTIEPLPKSVDAAIARLEELEPLTRKSRDWRR
jgi:hypothetical protein